MNSSHQDDHSNLQSESIASAPRPELPLGASETTSSEWWISEDGNEEGDAALAPSPTIAPDTSGHAGNRIGSNSTGKKRHIQTQGVIHYISNLSWYAVIGSAVVGAAGGFFASRSYAISLASNAPQISGSINSEFAEPISHIEADLPRLSAELASLDDAIAKLKNDNQKITARVSAIEDRVDRVGTDGTNRDDAINAEVKKKAEDLQWLTNQFLQLKNSVDAMKMH